MSVKHLPLYRRIFSANVYTEVDRALIPTGRVASVQGTPLDLTKSTQLGKVVPNPIDTNCPPRCWTRVLAASMLASVTHM